MDAVERHRLTVRPRRSAERPLTWLIGVAWRLLLGTGSDGGKMSKRRVWDLVAAALLLAAPAQSQSVLRVAPEVPSPISRPITSRMRCWCGESVE